MSLQDLKRTLRARVMALRKNQHSSTVLEEAVSNIVDTIREGDTSLTRRRVVLNVHGCCVATCTMCPLPDEAVPAETAVHDHHIIAQLDKALEFLNEDVLTIYNNGNFFSSELSDNVREYIYKRVANSKVQTLIVESLPQFITKQKLEAAYKILGKKKLKVAIGLQSWNDEVREIAINSTCSKRAFVTAVKLLHSYDYGVQVFLMFAPPFLTLRESIGDIVNGIYHLHDLNVAEIIVSPMRVTAHTLVWEMYNRGEYFPPTQYSLCKLISAISDTGLDYGVRIAISTLLGNDGIEAVRIPVDDELIGNIAMYNATHNALPLQDAKYAKTAIDDLFDSRTIIERVDDYLKLPKL